LNKFPISPLFIPGNKIEWIAKTFDKGADSIIVDLEDSVPDKEKQNARTLISKKLKERKDFSASVFVRTNSPQSGKIPNDLEKTMEVLEK